MMWRIGALVVTAVALGGMMVAAYFKIQDKLDQLSIASIRVETKLDDLIQRVPPVVAPPGAPPKK